jgi:hypothetical protein
MEDVFRIMVLGEIWMIFWTVIVTKNLSGKCYFACENWMLFSSFCHSLTPCFTFPHRCQQADIKKQQRYSSEKQSDLGHFLPSLFNRDPCKNSCSDTSMSHLLTASDVFNFNLCIRKFQLSLLSFFLVF